MLQGHKAQLEPKEPQGQVHRELLAPQVAMEYKVVLDLLVVKALLAQVHRAQLDLQEPRVRLVLKELLVVLEAPVLKALLAVSAIPKVLFTVWFLVVN
jgi:hypothetical protein